MKRRRHTPEQVIRKLAEGDKLLNQGEDMAEVCRQLEIAEPTWHRWKAQYGGMKANDAKRLKELEHENGQLKKIVADLTLDVDMLREIAKGNFGEFQRSLQRTDHDGRAHRNSEPLENSSWQVRH
jgi:transposase-like protein